MEQKKPFKYYAIRIMNTVIFRRTVGQITAVHSKLYRPKTNFIVEQVTYTGGKVVGSMSYSEWASHGGKALNLNKCIKITREQYRGLIPFLQKGED